MEVGRHLTNPLEGCVRRQVAVHSQQPGPQGPARRRIEVDDLAARMHPRIGAAGGGGGDRLVGDDANGSIEDVLDAPGVTLGLPAEEAGAVVLEPGGKALAGRP